MGHCVLNEAEAPPAERQDVAELIAQFPLLQGVLDVVPHNPVRPAHQVFLERNQVLVLNRAGLHLG